MFVSYVQTYQTRGVGCIGFHPRRIQVSSKLRAMPKISNITMSTLDLQRLLDETAVLAAKRVLKEVGLIKDEISYREAVRRYGKWFKDHYTEGRLKGTKKGVGKNAKMHFSVAEIESLQSAEAVKASLLKA